MMTRDAKIGLLVGLAFILIVGILLSEHITTATAPRQAPLAQAGDRVRQGVSAPVPPTPAVADARIDPDPRPKVAVVTREQLDSPILPPTAKVELGAPREGQIKVIRIDQPHDPIASAIEVPSAGPETALLAATTRDLSPPLTRQPEGMNDPLQRVARENGVELMNLDGSPLAGSPDAPRPSPAPLPVHSNQVREYIARPGDSLSRMAARLLGADTPANRQLIVSLNQSLQKDSNRILAGAKYLIPTDPWAAALGVDSGGASAEPEARPAGVVKPAAITVYVVKAGDSLWKIAERECGTVNAISTIKSLNADAFAKTETVKVGQKLTLPKKP